MAEETSKSVTFNNSICVVLIPELKEYETAKLKTVLWYNTEEMLHFRNKYIEEITRNFILSDKTDRP